MIFNFLFFQAEDGIRDGHVTGVQTCALPISAQDQIHPGNQFCFTFGAVRKGGIIRGINQVAARLKPLDFLSYAQAANAGIKHQNAGVALVAHCGSLSEDSATKSLMIWWYFSFSPWKISRDANW